MIRLAEYEDLFDIYKLVCVLENIPLNYEHFKNIYKKELENQDSFFYVYVEEEKVLGFISLYVKEFLHHDGKTGEIAELVVDQHHRGEGIGQSLIKYVEELGDSLGLEEIELCTSLWRKDAHHFYEKNEFIMNHYNYIKKIY